MASLSGQSSQALEVVGFGVTGGDEKLENSLQDASLVIGAAKAETTDPQEILAAARSDYARFVSVLYDNGYFGPVISIRVDGREAAEISPLFVPDAIRRVDIRVTTGAVYRFGAVTVDPLAPDTELPEAFLSGETAGTQAIATTARRAVRSWRDVGYAKADISNQRIVADHAARTVTADLDIVTGPRVQFGDLIVSGNEDVDEAAIRRIAGLPSGEVFSPDAVEEVTENLRRTGTFRSVVLTESDEIGPVGQMDMMLTVSEGLPRRIGFGAEYSNQDGIELSGFWTHRNITGRADRLELSFDIEGIAASNRDVGTALSARYTIPGVIRTDTDFFALARLVLLEERDYSGEAIDIGFGYVRRFSDRLTGEASLNLNYARIDDAFGESRYRLVGVPIRFTYDGRDDLLDPTSGYFLDGQAMPYVGFAGTENGLRVYGDARLYQGFGDDNRVVLAGRFQLGSVSGPALNETPNYFLFYSGGGGTVRGQEYQDLGVDLGGGQQTGGRSFAGLAVEARARVRDNIQVVGFYDWGYIGAESFPDGSGESHAGAGLGVRYLTPIGPLRVDVGTPVAGGDTSSDLLLYIGIGQAF